MRKTVSIEDRVRADAKSNCAAMVAALMEFTRRRRNARLLHYFGKCSRLCTLPELQSQRTEH